MTYTHRKTVLRYWRHKCFRNTAEGEVVEDSEGFYRCSSCDLSVNELVHNVNGFEKDAIHNDSDTGRYDSWSD
jgi:hypothetical protein